MLTHSVAQTIEHWPLERFIHYVRNPRKNDHVVDRMAASISEFGFRLPVLARSSGDVIDGHLRLKAAQKLGITEVPVILCDDWTEGQVKAFRLLVREAMIFNPLHYLALLGLEVLNRWLEVQIMDAAWPS